MLCCSIASLTKLGVTFSLLCMVLRTGQEKTCMKFEDKS